jgi:predicted GNAT superfamily acetyltransferase
MNPEFSWKNADVAKLLDQARAHLITASKVADEILRVYNRRYDRSTIKRHLPPKLVEYSEDVTKKRIVLKTKQFNEMTALPDGSGYRIFTHINNVNGIKYFICMRCRK